MQGFKQKLDRLGIIRYKDLFYPKNDILPTFHKAVLYNIDGWK